MVFVGLGCVGVGTVGRVVGMFALAWAAKFDLPFLGSLAGLGLEWSRSRRDPNVVSDLFAVSLSSKRNTSSKEARRLSWVILKFSFSQLRWRSWGSSRTNSLRQLLLFNSPRQSIAARVSLHPRRSSANFWSCLWLVIGLRSVTLAVV